MLITKTISMLLIVYITANNYCVNDSVNALKRRLDSADIAMHF